MTVHYPPALQEILDEFSFVEDQETRMEMLCDYSRKLPPVPLAIASPPYAEANRVKNCESLAYLFAEPSGDGNMRFHIAVESPQGITARALAAILTTSLSGLPRSTVAGISDDIVFAIFGQLSMPKALGLRSMVNALREEAARDT